MQQSLLKKMYTNPYKAGVKLLASGTDSNAYRKALHIIMKDSAGKFVERKALAGFSGEEFSNKPALTQILYRDKQYEATLIDLQARLAVSGISSSIQHY